MADRPGTVATLDAVLGNSRAEEAIVCRYIRQGFRRTGLKSVYRWLWRIEKPSHPPRPASPQGDRNRRRRMLRPSREERAVFPFLSGNDGHDTHGSRCYETHLADAVKLNVFKEQ